MANANYPLGTIVNNHDARWQLVDTLRLRANKRRPHSRLYRTWQKVGTQERCTVTPREQREWFTGRRDR